MRTCLRLAAWLLVAALVFVTLAPIGLRPSLGPPNLERACAYGALGLVLALAYPRHRLAVLFGILGLAGLLELGQGLTPSRHGRVADFLVKGGAAAAGTLAAFALSAIAAHRQGT